MDFVLCRFEPDSELQISDFPAKQKIRSARNSGQNLNTGSTSETY